MQYSFARALTALVKVTAAALFALASVQTVSAQTPARGLGFDTMHSSGRSM